MGRDGVSKDAKRWEGTGRYGNGMGRYGKGMERAWKGHEKVWRGYGKVLNGKETVVARWEGMGRDGKR